MFSKLFDIRFALRWPDCQTSCLAWSILMLYLYHSQLRRLLTYDKYDWVRVKKVGAKPYSEEVSRWMLQRPCFPERSVNS